METFVSACDRYTRVRTTCWLGRHQCLTQTLDAVVFVTEGNCEGHFAA